MTQHTTPTRSGFRNLLYERLSIERARADIQRLDRLTRHGAPGIVRTAILGFSNNNDLLWASALTYTVSLSLIPILAVALSAVKVFGGVESLKPLIKQYLAINSPQITNQILSLVSNINARTLGTVGGATLLITVIITLSTVEQSLNVIFNVSRGRSWLRKFTDYLSITFTVPLLLAAAVPLKTNMQANLPDLPGLGWIVATIPIWAGFSFLYLFFPNTRVRVGSAAIGGLGAAILFEFGQWGYLKSQVGAAQYQAIYGALAAIPILLTWIYIAWIIVLVGAEITAAVQGIEPAFTIDYRSPVFVRTAALLTVFRAAERMLSPQTNACSNHSLAAEMGVPVTAIQPVIDRLKQASIIVESSEPPPREGIFLARDSSTISLAEVLGAFFTAPENIHGDERISSLLKGLNSAEQDAMSDLTVKDLVSGHFEPPLRRHAAHGNAEPRA